MSYNEQFIVTTYNIAHNWIVSYRVQKACGCLHMLKRILSFHQCRIHLHRKPTYVTKT